MYSGVNEIGGEEFVSATAMTDPRNKLIRTVFMTKTPVGRGKLVLGTSVRGTLRACRPEFQIRKTQFRRKSGAQAVRNSGGTEAKESPGRRAAKANSSAAGGTKTIWLCDNVGGVDSSGGTTGTLDSSTQHPRPQSQPGLADSSLPPTEAGSAKLGAPMSSRLKTMAMS